MRTIAGDVKERPLRCVGLQIMSMGIGTALQVLTVPADATHVFCAPAGGENSQSLWLSMAVTGSAQAAAWQLSASGSGGAGLFEAALCPIPRDPTGLVTSYSLRRNVTTAAIDYVVFYFAP